MKHVFYIAVRTGVSCCCIRCHSRLHCDASDIKRRRTSKRRQPQVKCCQFGPSILLSVAIAYQLQRRLNRHNSTNKHDESCCSRLLSPSAAGAGAEEGAARPACQHWRFDAGRHCAAASNRAEVRIQRGVDIQRRPAAIRLRFFKGCFDSRPCMSAMQDWRLVPWRAGVLCRPRWMPHHCRCRVGAAASFLLLSPTLPAFSRIIPVLSLSNKTKH